MATTTTYELVIQDRGRENLTVDAAWTIADVIRLLAEERGYRVLSWGNELHPHRIWVA